MKTTPPALKYELAVAMASTGVLQMLNDTPQHDYVEGAAFPKAGSQLTGSHIEAELSAECVSQSAVVFNGPHVPACTVCRVKEITGAASDFQ